MAGLGFKDFQVGEVLTSSDVDGYLMQQAVMNFVDSAARGSALGTATGTAVPLAEGMISYVADTDAVEVYDGAGWIAAGMVVEVQHVLKTDTQTNSSVAAGSAVDVSGLSITHALSNAGNRLIISAYFGAAGNSQGQGNTGLSVAVDGTLVAIGDASGTRTRVGAGGFVTSGADAVVVAMPSMTFVYSPGDTSSHTYQVRAVNIMNAARNLQINRSSVDTADASGPRTTSGLTIMEVKA